MMQQSIIRSSLRAIAKQSPEIATSPSAPRDDGGEVMNKKIIIIAAVLIIGFASLLIWATKESSRPQPGETLADLGQAHVTDITGIEYNSNPPTSGTHFPVWAKIGVYDRVLSDGYLIHSLEHGYVVISYNCDNKFSIFNFQFSIPKAFAHEGEEVQPSTATASNAAQAGSAPASPDSGQGAAPLHRMIVDVSGGMNSFTPENPPAAEVELSEAFRSDSCKKLVTELSEFTKKYDRIVVVPRPTLDVPIALTAWTKILKLQKVDEDLINEFISAYHNKGPEATRE